MYSALWAIGTDVQKYLNEPIARLANKEDGCTGHYYKTHPCALPFGPPVQAFKEQIELGALIKFDLPIKPLLHFEGAAINSEQDGILFSTIDYLELVDLTGRCIREDKRGAIPMQLPPILQRLDIDKKAWLVNATQFEKDYRMKFSKRSNQRRDSA